MSFLKSLGRVFEEEKPKQLNPVKAEPIDRAIATCLNNMVNKSNKVSKTNEYLVDELKKCRVSIARREGIKPYMVFTDWQLKAIVEAKPINEKELSWVEGFDEKKALKYGKEISRIFRYL